MTHSQHTVPRPPRSATRAAIRRSAGLTLVEVLAVVVILGLIAATLTMSFRGQVGTAKRQLAKTGIGVVVNAIETFALETGRVPTMEEGLDALTRPTPGRVEPFIKSDKLRDPWGSRYQYITPGPTGAPGTYQVISLGSDRASGGTAGTDAADISSDDLSEHVPASGDVP